MSDSTSIGVKIHDVHHGLIRNVNAIVETEYALLKELGVAIQIATTIKDHETIKDAKQLYAAAGELKISRPAANAGLDHLERMGFVRLKRASVDRSIERIDVTVPGLGTLYKGFGEYFASENDSRIAAQTLEMLERLSAFPHKQADIVSSLGLSPTELDLILDVGKASSLLDTYISPSDSQSVLYSPLYWDDNPQAIFKLLESHSSDTFLSTIDKVKKHQGLPDGRLSDLTLTEAVTLGCLPTLAVNSTSGLKKFIFTPRVGVGKIEKELLHKARVLISCVRYGENFAGITKIFSPDKLIGALVNRGYLKGHSEGLKQYEPARNLGLVKIIPTHAGRYEVHFIDNDENQMVVQMATEMLQVGETSKYDDSEENARKILMPGQLLHPTQTRTQVVHENPVERSTSTIKKVNDLLRGIE